MRVLSLPVVPPVVCPAASPVAGVTPERGGVICGVIQRDRQLDPGVGITAGQLAVARGGDHGEGSDVFLTVKSDPSTIERFCCGDDVPVLDHFEKPGGRSSYTFCPTFQAEKDRIAAGRERLTERREAESFGTGVSSLEAHDPWAAAARDVVAFG